ncbi:MAG: rifampicin phosphotransferase [Actinomycetota bacterium]|nr:rifampicin phosphotransferase [Actinomycetota bacterium]
MSGDEGAMEIAGDTPEPPGLAAAGPNPMHMRSGPGISWTTANFGEAIPGVQTPLCLSFWVDASEASLRRMSVDLGAYSRREAAIDGRYMGTFYGRMCGNITTFRALADRMPATSGDAFEEQIFGVRRTGEQSSPVRRRYPVVAAKLPMAALRVPPRLVAARRANEAWWRAAVADPGTDLPAAVATLAEAFRRFETLIHAQGLVGMLAQACFERVRALATAAGLDGAEAELVTGYGGMEETLLLTDLWRTARGGMAMAEFLSRHGFHGPSTGDITTSSWREDPAPLEALLPVYRDLPDSQAPGARQEAQVASRRAMEDRLLAALPAVQRPVARLVLKLTERFVPLREVGKAAYVQAFDVARAAARAAGAALEKEGLLSDASDVFFLTREELCGRLPDDVAAVVAERRAFHDACRQVAIPEYWTGMPALTPMTGHTENDDHRLDGIGVSPGRVTAPVRVIHDPLVDTTLEPGEILVCATTNPAWITLFLVAGALVIDVGGPLSHGAIAARELGIPCVINTRHGTARLRTGDLVVVDGDAGTVRPATSDTIEEL